MQILTFRLSVFGDFKRFVPTAENTINWSMRFKEAGYELLPNVIQNQATVFTFPFVSAQQMIPEKRMQFISQDGKIVVRFLAERVDVEITRESTSNYDRYFIDKIHVLSDLMRCSLEMLGDIKGTRLAYYTDALIEESERYCFDSFYNNNVDIFINEYEGEYVEWSHRFNKRITFNFAEKQEKINAILLMESGELQTINPATSVQQVIKGLRVVSDINTVAEDSEERFRVACLDEFYMKAQELHIKLLNQIVMKTLTK